MNDPSTSEEWIAIAEGRGRDAQAIFENEPASIGSVYMAGYVIECSLKAYILKAYNAGLSKTEVRKIHNLRSLLQDANLRPSDLSLSDAAKTFYFSQWTPNFRYYSTLEGGYGMEDLLRGASSVGKYIRRLAGRLK